MDNKMDKKGRKLSMDELDKVAGGMDPRTPTGHGRGEFESQIEPQPGLGGEDGSDSGHVAYIHS